MNEPSCVSRRAFLKTSLGALAAGSAVAGCRNAPQPTDSTPMVRTVLGPVSPQQLGATLTHEHAPFVDWSELYETPVAPTAPRLEEMLTETAKLLDSYQQSLAPEDGPGAIVETTPIRVGRYPQVLVDLAKRTKVHLIASTGFWCEAMAPQHPWAVRLSIASGGTRDMTELFVREMTEGMEDPSGEWGERFTDIKAGVIKIGTSTHLRPSERAVHIAAAHACQEIACPITTHTTDGGGLEQAQLLLHHGAKPERVIIGHQGYRDDRLNDEANDYHLRLAELGVGVQFDRVGHEKYSIASQARQIKHLVDAGHTKQVFVSHDHVPYFCTKFSLPEKSVDDWSVPRADFTVVTTQLVPALKELGVTDEQVRAMLVDNPARFLAF